MVYLTQRGRQVAEVIVQGTPVRSRTCAMTAAAYHRERAHHYAPGTTRRLEHDSLSKQYFRAARWLAGR